jgi:tetratricopeptide (TPR) repeat protein
MTIKPITLKQMERAGRLGLSGEYAEALDVLDRLIKLYPDCVSAMVYKGNLLDLWGLSGSLEEAESEKLYEAARACYEQALEMDSECIPAYIDLGDYWERKGDHHRALHSFDTAIAMLQQGKHWVSREDEIDDVFSRKTLLLKELGRYAEAAFCLAAGRRLNPDSLLLKNDGK